MFEFLTGIAVSSISLLLIISIRDIRQSKAAQSMFLLFSCALAFVISPYLTDLPRSIAHVMINTIPAAFWLWCFVLFSDNKKIPGLWIGIAIASIALPTWYLIGSKVNIFSDSTRFWLVRVPEKLELLLIASGFWIIIKEYNQDLVAPRRSLRLIILIVIGISVTISVLSYYVDIGGRSIRLISTSLASMFTALVLLGIRWKDIFVINSRPSTELVTDKPVVVNKETETLVQLNNLMSDGFYRKEKLTLKQLSEALSCPEYRVRKLISDELGYRNFNDYINKLRIDEASARLTSELDTPITNIWLDMGYRTASSFNRAFRDQMGVSPTEYRNVSETDNS